MTFLKY